MTTPITRRGPLLPRPAKSCREGVRPIMVGADACVMRVGGLAPAAGAAWERAAPTYLLDAITRRQHRAQVAQKADPS